MPEGFFALNNDMYYPGHRLTTLGSVTGARTARASVLYLSQPPPSTWQFSLPGSRAGSPPDYRLLAYCPLMCRSKGLPYAAVRFRPL